MECLTLFHESLEATKTLLLEFNGIHLVKDKEGHTPIQDFSIFYTEKVSSNTDSLDISTGIAGEKQLPTEVVFDKLVQESVKTHSDILVIKLKKIYSHVLF